MKHPCRQVGTKVNENVIPACIVCHSSLSGLSFRLVRNHSEERCWTSQHDRWEKDCGDPRQAGTGSAAMTKGTQMFSYL